MAPASFSLRTPFKTYAAGHLDNSLLHARDFPSLPGSPPHTQTNESCSLQPRPPEGSPATSHCPLEPPSCALSAIPEPGLDSLLLSWSPCQCQRPFWDIHPAHHIAQGSDGSAVVGDTWETLLRAVVYDECMH